MSDKNEVIEYIKNDLQTLEKKVDDGFRDLNIKIDVFMANCLTKTDFKEYKDGIRERLDKVEKEKLDKEDFDSIKTTLNRINWIVITAVVAGLLTLIIK